MTRFFSNTCALFMAFSVVTFLPVKSLTSYVFAAEGTELVHVVDMQRVISESIVGKAAKNDMEGEIKKREGQLSKLQNDLKAMKTDLDKQATLLSQDALKAKEENFEKKQREFQRAFQDNRDELTKKNNEAIEKIVKGVDIIIKDIAHDKGYKMIIEKDNRFVIYADSKLDLTEEIIKSLDSKKLDS